MLTQYIPFPMTLMVKILAFKSPRAFERQRTLSHLDPFASRPPIALSIYQNQPLTTSSQLSMFYLGMNIVPMININGIREENLW